MSNLSFIKKLVNGKNCYSDHMGEDELKILRIESAVEKIIHDLIANNKIVFIAGNPGDGKTYIIKSLQLDETIYAVTDLNNVSDYQQVALKIVNCFDNSKPAVIAANEYPFLLLEKEIRAIRPDIADEIVAIRDSAIVYAPDNVTIKKIAVIDLNNRNLLDTDRNIPEKILDKMLALLKEDDIISPSLKYNITALENERIKKQLLGLFQLSTMGNKHFAMRDILGAFAFLLTACDTDEYRDVPYYKAVFLGQNNLLETIQKYDPVRLSNFMLDEKLWNGNIKDGWLIEAPEKWPNDECYDNSVSEALEQFKDIKRRYYFENIDGERLCNVQPYQILDFNLFSQFETKRRFIKENIILAINKLFLPADTNKKELHIWTTHHYNLSMETTVAVSTTYVSSNNLDIFMPRPTYWLREMEFTPSYIILKPKSSGEGDQTPSLRLDIEFLRVLESVKNGYPVSLLPPQYEQAANSFLQQLKNSEYVDEYGEDEIIIASRENNYKVQLSTNGNKYSFVNDD